ncbi:fasciclin domain-containing protein [Candidatus Poriferisocius sp.]|uniref:fasciclin domain-containing protein n=1 Tax=Candidatus Poriferisocius sp. TaxID=3101276 RepID=UPI003B02B557
MSRKILSLLAALLALSLIAAACGNDDDAESTDAGTSAAQSEPEPAEEMAEEAEVAGTVVEVAVESGAFPTLVAAVQAAGLVETLSGPGPFTVFAPTEEAFAAALAALGMTAQELLGDTELLGAVLAYHVLPVAAPAEVVVTLDGQSVATVGGAEVSIAVDGDTVMVNDATVVTADIEASNGIIHVIDTVLIPPAAPQPEPAEEPAEEMAEEAEVAGTVVEVEVAGTVVEVEVAGTVVEVAVESGAFPTLVAAVQAAGLVETLSGPGPFTVFAPTEEAFAAALAALGMTAQELLGDTELLGAVLAYHVLPVAAPAEVVVTLDGQSVATVGGAEVSIAVDGDTVMVNDATVVTADIEASNGIIHVIDTVLIPPSS